MITVVTFLWKGWRPVYESKHVNAWARMVKAHLKQPHRCVCITDLPHGIECETFPLWTFPQVWQRPEIVQPEQTREVSTVHGRRMIRPVRPITMRSTERPPAPQQRIIPNSFLRLRLFDPMVARWLGTDRIFCLDLDSVVMDDLDPLLDTSATFAAVRGVSATLNGSGWLLQVGAHRRVWDDFDPISSPQILERERVRGGPVGSDQAWLSRMLGDAPTWGPEHGVYQFTHLPAQRENQRVVFFAGGTKPWDQRCQQVAPDLYDTYRSYLEAA